MQRFVICLLITLFTHCLSDEINYQPFQKPSFPSELLSHSPTPQPISYCNAYKHRNTYLQGQIDLNCYTANQLQHYFNMHHYSEQQILTQELLYLSDEFVKLVKTYPAYEQTIEKLHTKFEKFGAFKKVLHTFTGTYSSGLKRKIHLLYQEIQLKKEYEKRQIDAQKIEYQELKPIYEQYSPLLAKAIEKRIDAHSLEQLQKIINLESMDIIEKAKSLPAYSILYPHQNALIDCATTIKDYNKEKCFDKAVCIADFCWSLIDYGQAIMEGAALGLYATAQDLIEHPIEATICIVAGKQILTYQLCKVLYNVANIGLTAITDYDTAKEKWDDYLTPINNIIAAIENKEITLRDSLKAGTAFIVGYKAQSKLLYGLGKFCTTVKQNVTRFAQNNIFCKPQAYFTTPEGVFFKSTNNIEKNFKKINPSNLKNTIADKIAKVNTNCRAILKDGYYEVNGFKFTEYYYNYLWNNGRKAPSLIAKSILENVITVTPDPKQIPGFFKYLTDGWEMIYNPTTKIVSHIQPKPKFK